MCIRDSFRNALVRANYTNLQKGIHETTCLLYTSATYLLGRLYQNAGDTENARQCFSRIITVFPESEQASQAASAMGEMGLATAASGQSTAESEADRNRETTATKETERDRQEEDNPPETTQAENVPETIPETAPEPGPETVPVNDVN